MIRARTFKYDALQDRVVEVTGTLQQPSFEQLHDRTKEEYQRDRHSKAGALRQITLERAERREFAHQRYGTESRWRD